MSNPRITQIDRFVHQRLPPPDRLPRMLPLPGVDLDGAGNCVSYLLDRHSGGAQGRRIAVMGGDRAWSYDELYERVCRITDLLLTDFGVVAGNRVLIRGANSPEAVAVWLTIQKIGAVAVTTMSLLRAGELKVILEMSRPTVAVCEEALAGELDSAISAAGLAVPVIRYGADRGELQERMTGKRARLATTHLTADDISIIAFTSGTTGRPKATIHAQRDILAICETVSRHIIQPRQDDIFIGTAPLAFTFGLGGLLVFPLHAGACAVLNPRYSPESLLEAIARYEATVCFTVPTFYQQMLKHDQARSPGRLRLAVSSGEALPLPVREACLAATGLPLTEVLGSTEMLHAFVGATGADIRPGFIGPPLPGYEVTSWYGFFGPRGMPKDIVANLNTHFNEIIKEPAVADRLTKVGVIVQGSTPEAFGKLMASEYAKWDRVRETAGFPKR